MTTGNGDSTLARYGVGVPVKARRGSQVVENASVMPNHLALARRFAMSDNFYCDSDVSADGHRWLVNTYPNEWVENGHGGSLRRQTLPARQFQCSRQSGPIRLGGVHLSRRL